MMRKLYCTVCGLKSNIFFPRKKKKRDNNNNEREKRCRLVRKNSFGGICEYSGVMVKLVRMIVGGEKEIGNRKYIGRATHDHEWRS